MTQPATTSGAAPDLARIPSDRRLTGAERAEARRRVVAAYRVGYSLERLAKATGRGLPLIYAFLAEAGEPLRTAAAQRMASAALPPVPTLRFPDAPPGDGLAYVPLMADVESVRVGDLVLVHDATRTVRDMRQVDCGKVLILDGGVTYRLAWHEPLPARRLCTG